MKNEGDSEGKENSVGGKRWKSVSWARARSLPTGFRPVNTNQDPLEGLLHPNNESERAENETETWREEEERLGLCLCLPRPEYPVGYILCEKPNGSVPVTLVQPETHRRFSFNVSKRVRVTEQMRE